MTLHNTQATTDPNRKMKSLFSFAATNHTEGNRINYLLHITAACYGFDIRYDVIKNKLIFGIFGIPHEFRLFFAAFGK